MYFYFSLVFSRRDVHYNKKRKRMCVKLSTHNFTSLWQINMWEMQKTHTHAQCTHAAMENHSTKGWAVVATRASIRTHTFVAHRWTYLTVFRVITAEFGAFFSAKLKKKKDFRRRQQKAQQCDDGGGGGGVARIFLLCLCVWKTRKWNELRIEMIK